MSKLKYPLFGQKMKKVEKTASNRLLKTWAKELKGEGLKRVQQELHRRKNKRQRHASKKEN